MASISLILGIKLKSMWGSPVVYLLGVCFFVYFPFNISKSFKPMLKACYVALFLFASAFVLQVLFTTSAKFKLNALDFTNSVNVRNYEYVGGSVWLASTVGVYSSTKPQVLFLMSPNDNPWIDMDDVAKKGILVVTENLWEYENYQKNFTNLSKPEIYLLKVKNVFGKTKEHKLYYGSIAGE
jgi:membrane protease YdiL (CAAX protease family)